MSGILLKPVAAQLGHKRLLIVADGALQENPIEEGAMAVFRTREAAEEVRHRAERITHPGERHGGD